jgi:deoxyadenosine/deoxycytidine kinase
MIIKVFGPVGSGKSTISSLLARKLNLNYIPEVEDRDVKFFRLLNKRNKTQKIKDKMEFQCYTFEQAYFRQFGQRDSVIDTPVDQHFIMAGCSLEGEEIKEYTSYYKDYLKKINLGQEKIINIVLYLPFEYTLERIKSRGRSEESLSKEEVNFYYSFYDKLFIQKMYPENSIVVDNTKDPESVVEEIFKLLV